MLQIFSHYGYFFLGSVFLGLVLLGYFYGDTVQFDNNIVFLYTVVLIPFFDSFIGFFKKEKLVSENIASSDSRNVWKILSLLVFLALLLYLGYGWVSVSLIGLFLASIMWQIDARVAFFGALILFLYIPLYLLMGDGETAEQLSIYAYYFLIIGVIIQICLGVFSKKSRTGKK